MLLLQAVMTADNKTALHDGICHRISFQTTVSYTFKPRLAQYITGKHGARLDIVLFKPYREFLARERRIFLDGDGIAQPACPDTLRLPWEHKVPFMPLEKSCQQGEVLAPRCFKGPEFLELC